jgi:hypothetical protein
MYVPREVGWAFDWGAAVACSWCLGKLSNSFFKYWLNGFHRPVFARSDSVCQYHTMAAPSTKGQVRRNTISNAGRVKSFVDDSCRERAIVSMRVISVSRSTETRLVLWYLPWPAFARSDSVCQYHTMAAPSTKGQVRRNTISNAGRVKSF